MFDVLSFADLDGQHVELLPARTVLSMFSAGGPRGGDAGNGGPGGTGGAGAPGTGGAAAISGNWIYVEGDMFNTLTGGAAGTGGAADGGAAIAGEANQY